MIEIRHLTPAVFGDPLMEVRIGRGARIWPPSLKWLLGAFAALCLGVAAGFALLGALPVLGFAGLEIVLLFVLLRVSFRRACVIEAVSLAGDTTVVRRGDAGGMSEAARLQSYWLQVDSAAQGLVLRSREQRIAVGAGLAAAEVGELAEALRLALHRLKTTPAGMPVA